MKARLCLAAPMSLALTLFLGFGVGCDGDRAADGARGSCAEGGSLGVCEGEVADAIDACDRMVACAAIPVDAEDDNGFDWGRCVDRIESLTPTQERFVVSCIGASTCDDLKIQGSPNAPNGRGFCFEFGDR